MGYETHRNVELIKTNTLISGTLNTNFTWGACNDNVNMVNLVKIIINYYHEIYKESMSNEEKNAKISSNIH